MIQAFLALLLPLGFFALEGRLRQGQEAISLKAGESDAGSTRLVGLALVIGMFSLVAGALLDLAHILRLPSASLVGWFGVIVMVAGLTLRVWSMRVLGRFYTRTLKVQGEQRVVREGPYRLVRHPGYLGIILLWLGAALAMGNWLSLVVIAVAVSIAYARRIQAEDAMLIASLGEEYRKYAARTRRLIPFVY